MWQNAGMPPASLRSRLRTEMTVEIKAAARRHLASGPAGLSLRAVARDLGMAPSGIYQYFDSRDKLLTALIVDAYDSLGAAAEAADPGGNAFASRWLDVCLGVRRWGLEHGPEWALLYGSPVSGYQAPRETVGPGTRVIRQVAAIVRDAAARDALDGGAQLLPVLAGTFAAMDEDIHSATPAPLVGRAAAASIHMAGAVSAEVFGHLASASPDEREAFFVFQMRGGAALAGLRDLDVV
jgi:AcrR family transcriptional regulator